MRTIASDSFNRADNAASMGSTEVGGFAWTPVGGAAVGGTWGIQSNKAYVPTGGSGRQFVAISSGASDATVSADLSGVPLGASTHPWVAFRGSDNLNFLFVSAQTGTTVEVYKCVAGAFTQIGTAAYTWAENDTVKVVFSGTSINVYINNVLKISGITESFNQSATLIGLANSVPGDASRWDNFLVTTP